MILLFHLGALNVHGNTLPKSIMPELIVNDNSFICKSTPPTILPSLLDFDKTRLIKEKGCIFAAWTFSTVCVLDNHQQDPSSPGFL